MNSESDVELKLLDETSNPCSCYSLNQVPNHTFLSDTDTNPNHNKLNNRPTILKLQSMTSREDNRRYAYGGVSSTNDSLATADSDMQQFVLDSIADESFTRTMTAGSLNLSQTFNCHERVPSIRKRRDLCKVKHTIIMRNHQPCMIIRWALLSGGREGFI